MVAPTIGIIELPTLGMKLLADAVMGITRDIIMPPAWPEVPAPACCVGAASGRGSKFGLSPSALPQTNLQRPAHWSDSRKPQTRLSEEHSAVRLLRQVHHSSARLQQELDDWEQGSESVRQV